jgi:hypothetical protein
LRFGTIAMMNDEPIQNPDTEHWQETFLAEVKTIPGYSGSPIFLNLPQYRYINHPAYNSDEERKYQARQWLLGIEWSNIPDLFDHNTGMSGVIPAWKIAELLDKEVFQMQRKKGDEIEAARQSKSRIKLTSTDTPVSKTRDIEVTEHPDKAKFFEDLAKAVRKRKNNE